jgi:minimal PKS acyl carrier protein
MSHLTLDELKTVMLRCSGLPDQASVEGDIRDITFEDLGYDSLAVLEIASAMQRQYKIEISDESIETMTTPGAVLDFVNGALQAAA